MLEKLKEYVAIARVAKKPDWKELIDALKAIAIGTIVIGVIGFLIQLFFQIFR